MNSSSLRLLFCLLAAVALSPRAARARVGETREEIEKRVLAPGVGRILLPNESVPLAPGAAPAGRRGGMAGGGRGGRNSTAADPFREIRPFLPAGLTEVIYLKSDTPAGKDQIVNLVNPESCWHQHVLYAAGKSVMEAYVRVGATLSEFEVNGLLAVNKGASVWKKAADVVGLESGIGTDFALDDGVIRAKQNGNVLLMFAPKVDAYVLAQQQAQAQAQQQEEQVKAPASVQGF